VGRRPIQEFIDKLSHPARAAVLAGMEDVRDRGLQAARHLDGDIWEVRVDGDRVIYRVLFAQEGSRGQILLTLEGFNKKTRKHPGLRSRWRRGDWRTGDGEEINDVSYAASLPSCDESRRQRQERASLSP